MADVVLDLQNSSAKDLFGQGVRAYVLQDYDTAVQCLSKSSELLSTEHGSETHDSLGDVYLYYGKALLELSRKESGPLGEGVLKNIEEESDLDDEEGDEGEAKTDENEEPAPAEVTSSDKTEEDSEAQKNEEAAEEELTDLQVAWEVLELAKQIFTERGDPGKKYLAEAFIVLGEISLESGNYPSAVEDMNQGLDLQKSLFEDDSRTIAETYYKLGGAYSTNGQIREAIESFQASSDCLQKKLDNLNKNKDQVEANKEEIEELEILIPEIKEKIADMKNVIVEIVNKAATSSEAQAKSSSEAASSSKPANDISHLVKRKRKEDEAPGANPAKKPSP